jgi:hypothetical protein
MDEANLFSEKLAEREAAASELERNLAEKMDEIHAQQMELDERTSEIMNSKDEVALSEEKAIGNINFSLI